MKTLLSLGLCLLCGPLWAGQVLIIESYHPEYPWDADYLRAIDEILGANHDIDSLYLDTKRIKPDAFDAKADRLLEDVKARQPDIIFLGDDNALELMGPRLDPLGIPTVFFGVNGHPDQYGLKGAPWLTGVLERPLFRQTVRHLRKVLTSNNRFLVLMDDSPTMRNAVTEAWGDQRRITIQGSTLDILLTNEAERWLGAVATAHQDYDAVIFGTHHTLRYADDNYAEPDDLMARAYADAQVPLFAFWDFFVAEGMTAGGYVLSGYDQGKTAARMGQLILRGVDATSVPMIVGQTGQYRYSRSGMERWDIELSTLIASQTMFVK